MELSRITIPREKLVNALSKVISIIEKRNTMPILEHVKIELKNDLVTLTSTDMDITVVVSFLIAKPLIETVLSFTTLAQPLYDMARKLSESSEIHLDIADMPNGSITIIAGNSIARLPCLNSEEFPSFDHLSLDHVQFKMPKKQLFSLLSSTKHAISTGDTRYYLNGVYLHNVEEATEGTTKLIAVATDVHRLAKVETEAPNGCNIQRAGIIIPRKTVYELLKLLETDSEEYEINVEIDNSKIKCYIRDTIIVSKLMDASFPNYAAALPLHNDKKLTVDIKDLSRAIDFVTTVSDSKIKSVKMKIEQDKVTLSVDNQVVNKTLAIQEISANFVSADYQGPLVLLINARYIMDCLNVIKGNNVEFYLKDSDSALLIKDISSNNCAYVLMPMQVSLK